LDVDWVTGLVAPRLANPLAFFECRPWQAYDGGDHSIYVGHVVNFARREGPALGFFAGGFVTLQEPPPDERPFPYDVFELPYDAYEQA
jgi:flavin reductase (DIM6/NTAB) family NADH-FMN oxidoreductase RutF